MDLTSIAVIAGGLLAFSLASGRLDGTVVTPPMVFILFGFLAGAEGLAIASVNPDHSTIHLIAKLTLILVLFTDAARINVTGLRRDHDLPVRMLLIGLPLTIAVGTVLAVQLFPALLFWEAVLLAALLAPTDAALGQAVVTAREIPVRIRQAVNVESGLNDGIALPAVLLFAAFASAQTDVADAGSWIRFGLMQVALGPIAGIGIAYAGARLIDAAVERGWVNEAYQGISILALAFFTYAAAELIGGNGFIAAFVGGMVFGNTIRHPCAFLFDFMETEGTLLMLITFFIFGAALLPEGLAHLDAPMLLYAVLSLTVIRMIPVAISLIGMRLRLPTILFLGWFGPRGLASILFVLLILEEADVVHRGELLSITVATVTMSALLHGLSAAPLAKRYARMIAGIGVCQEIRPVTELPLREGPMSDGQTQEGQP